MPFPKEKINEIKIQIEKALASGAEPIAAFDADGTLWNMDMGENFFDYQINKKLLPPVNSTFGSYMASQLNLPIEMAQNEDHWSFYRRLHDADTAKAFLWLAQINAGYSESDIRQWAQSAFEEISEVPYFTAVCELIKFMQSLHMKIFIVTASIKWSVEPGARALGIPPENVVGVKTKVIDGKISMIQDGVITWHEGKVTGLLDTTANKHPLFAAGNTMGDVDLLNCATHVRLANCGADTKNSNFSTEQKLLAHAQEHGWFYIKY